MTEKQMNFCREYVKRGGSAAEAYMAAYNSESRGAAYVESCQLLKREDIQAYIAKLRKPIEKAITRKIVNERDYKKKLIQERIEECIARDDDAAIARYLEIWNKMDGEYVNLSKDLTDQKANITHLDTKTLQQLAGAEHIDVEEIVG